MKKHLCFILLLFVGELSWAQISNDKPKGQVVMITTKAYDEIYNFGEVSELKLRDEETVSYFDKRGNIIHERQIDYKGRIETAYLYTDEGKIIKELTTTPKATESAVVYDTLKLKLYTYDDSGRVKTESVFENKSLISKDRYEYTPTGYKKYQYEGDGTLSGVAEKKGNELSYISEKKGGGSIGYFDNVGHIVKMSVFLGASNGGLGFSSYFTYNKYGDLMCVSSHSGSVIKKPQKAIVYSQRPDGSIVANLENQYSKEQHKDENTYRYEYDVKENWTVKYDDKEKKRYVREIVYAKKEDDFGSVKHKIEESRHALDSVIYQEKVLKPRRLKEEKEARQKHERQILAAYIAKNNALAESRSQKYKLIDQKERMDSYVEDYPYICETVVWSCEDLLSLSSKPSTDYIDAVFHPIDVYAKRIMDYIDLQQTVIRSLINKNQKKENKTLEKSLKKAGNSTQRIAVLSSWLKNQGYDLSQKIVKKDPRKLSLYNEYREYKKKIDNAYNKRNSSLFKEFTHFGRVYVSDRLGGRFIGSIFDEPQLDNISTEHLSKCIEVQKFLYKLLTDNSLEEEREKLLARLKESVGYTLYRDINFTRLNWPLWFSIFEDYLRQNGIVIFNDESENPTKTKL